VRNICPNTPTSHVSWFKDLLVFLCQVIELLHNTLWWYLLCPLLCNTMVVAEFMINVVDTLFWE
jgi:hypothetical protein